MCMGGGWVRRLGAHVHTHTALHMSEHMHCCQESAPDHNQWRHRHKQESASSKTPPETEATFSNTVARMNQSAKKVVMHSDKFKAPQTSSYIC